MSSKKNKAIKLRNLGYSYKEICEKLHIAKSTASLWLRNISLNQKAKQRLNNNINSGIKAAIKTNISKRVRKDSLCLARARSSLKKININNKNYQKLILSLLYWCEGAKSDTKSRLSFINSDPQMLLLFINIMRKVYIVDEKKWRCCLHLHKYHNANKQLHYWSKLLNIPKKQFNKIYIKENNAKRIKKNYPGCLSLRYHDNQIAKELFFLYQEYYRGVG